MNVSRYSAHINIGNVKSDMECSVRESQCSRMKEDTRRHSEPMKKAIVQVHSARPKQKPLEWTQVNRRTTPIMRNTLQGYAPLGGKDMHKPLCPDEGGGVTTRHRGGARVPIDQRGNSMGGRSAKKASKRKPLLLRGGRVMLPKNLEPSCSLHRGLRLRP